MNLSSGPQKRTNVRPGFVAAKAAIHAIHPASTPLAARVAGELYMRPRRFSRPNWEREVLRGAHAFHVPFGESSLSAWEWGHRDAPPVLLVHGWEGRGSQLGALAPPLLARGFRVVTFDAPGHGRSAMARSSVVQFALAIERMAAAIGPLAGVIAHSVGGAAMAVALDASHGHLASKRFVLLAPPISPDRFFDHFSRALALGPHLEKHVLSYLEKSIGMKLGGLDVRTHAEHLTAPMLLVHDEGDREVPFEDGRAFAQAWKGSKLLVTSGLGHRAILRDPDVVDAAAAFIAGRDDVTEGLPLGSLEGDLFDRERRWARFRGLPRDADTSSRSK